MKKNHAKIDTPNPVDATRKKTNGFAPCLPGGMATKTKREHRIKFKVIITGIEKLRRKILLPLLFIPVEGFTYTKYLHESCIHCVILYRREQRGYWALIHTLFRC